MAKESWRSLIGLALHEANESWDDVIACTLDDEGLDEKFDDGYGGTQGMSFTAWTGNRVYFPVTYDGAEWVGSAPRNPCDEKTEHHGGG